MSDFLNMMAEKMQFIQCENDDMSAQLKAVAQNIQVLNIAQPSKCLFTNGTCCYSIDDCYNCPVHHWNDYFPTTRAVIE